MELKAVVYLIYPDGKEERLGALTDVQWGERGNGELIVKGYLKNFEITLDKSENL